jgi:hypothetical protein
MKDRYKKRRELQELLLKETMCGIQHTGWPCNSCFHNMDLPISDKRLHELWEATLILRGDYTTKDIPLDDKTLIERIDELIRLLKEHAPEITILEEKCL